MAQIREIKKRIGGVTTVQRITKTMQMIATAKFTTALQKVSAAKPYSERIGRLVGEALAAAGGDFEHLEARGLDRAGQDQAVARSQTADGQREG